MRLRSTLGVVCTLVMMLVFSSLTIARTKYKTFEFIEETLENAMSSADILALLHPIAHTKYKTSEFIQETLENAMSSADILAHLHPTVGMDASGAHQAVAYPLRQGFYVTALPQRSTILLRFEIDRSDPPQRETIAEVAFPAALGRTFVEFVAAALGSAETIFAAAAFAQPWELTLHAASPSGGEVQVTVAGDAMAQFHAGVAIASPPRPLDRFRVPTAFGAGRPARRTSVSW